MKTLMTAAVVTALLAGAALAASDSGQTYIFASVPKACLITDQSSSINLTGKAVGQWTSGTFSYQCNFTGNSQVLTFQSTNGGIFNPDNGTDLVDYGIYLNDAPNSFAVSDPAVLLASEAKPGPVPFFQIVDTTAANTNETAFFEVALAAPLTVAGTYSDTLAITIAP